MGKYLSLVGALLVLVGFHLMPKAEAQEPYVSPALLLTLAEIADLNFILHYPYRCRLVFMTRSGYSLLSQELLLATN